MGHYAAELLCDVCGHLRCICPPVSSATDHHWVVGDFFEVLTAIEYQNSCKDSTAFMARMMRKHYPDRANAEAAARIQCEEAVEACRSQLNYLKNVLKVKRPWEKK